MITASQLWTFHFYGVHTCQLIWYLYRYSIDRFSYHDFHDRGLINTYNEAIEPVVSSGEVEIIRKNCQTTSRVGWLLCISGSQMTTKCFSCRNHNPTLAYALPGLYLHKQHDECPSWSRIYFPFQSTWYHSSFWMCSCWSVFSFSMLCID